MEKALKILNDETLGTVIRTAVGHYLIGYIHPFYDGNGRLSRFISSYLLGKVFDPLVTCQLSYTVKQNLSAYYKAFDICNDKKNRGDLTPFILMFLRLILKDAGMAAEKMDSGREKLEFYGRILNEYVKNKEQNKLFYLFIQNGLFSETGFSVEELAKLMCRSIGTIRNMISRLKEKGVPIQGERIGKTKLYSLDPDELKEFLEQQEGIF